MVKNKTRINCIREEDVLKLHWENFSKNWFNNQRAFDELTEKNRRDEALHKNIFKWGGKFWEGSYQKNCWNCIENLIILKTWWSKLMYIFHLAKGKNNHWLLSWSWSILLTIFDMISLKLSIIPSYSLTNAFISFSLIIFSCCSRWSSIYCFSIMSWLKTSSILF
jgi:hypothetical protein